MNSLLILSACIGMALVTWISVACLWIAKEVKWLRAVLIPWMNSIHELIASKQ